MITAPSDLNVTDGQTDGHWHHREVKIRRQIIADIIGITDILSQKYRYMAHHYSLAIRQAFWKLPDVTHFRVLSTGLCSVHACGVPNEL